MDDAGARIRNIERRLLASSPGPWRWVGYDLAHPRRNWELVKAAGALESVDSGSGEPPTFVLGVAPVELYPNTYHWIVPKERASLKARAHTVAFSKDGRTLASGSAGGDAGGDVTLWDVATGKEFASLKGHGGQVLSVAFNKDGKLLAAGGAGGMKLWDLAPGK